MPNRLRLAKVSHAALEDNEPHQFAQRHALKIHARPDGCTIYTFIPKNACTTMRYSLAIANGCIETYEDFDWIHKNNFLFSANISELVTAPRSFVILRCPYSRLASFFLDKITSKSPPSNFLKKLLPELADISDLTFREFASVMSDASVRKANSHWRNQSDFLIFDNYTKYFCLEEFSDNIKSIEAFSGMKVHDTRSMSKHGTDQFQTIADRSFCDATAGDIAVLKENGHMPSHKSLYDSRTINIVTKAYSDDIELYRHHFCASNMLFNEKHDESYPPPERSED